MKYLMMLLVWSVAILSVFFGALLSAEESSYYNFLTHIYFIGVFIILIYGIFKVYFDNKKRKEDSKRRQEEWRRITNKDETNNYK